jgi:flagellar FlgN protein
MSAAADPVLVLALGAAIDECTALNEEILELTRAQRDAIPAGDAERVSELAGRIETCVLRLSSVEERRATAAANLADRLGLAATRWTALGEALDPVSRSRLEPRVARLERAVRDLELANAINGQLFRRELDLVDRSIRSALGAGPSPAARRYTSRGAIAGAPPAPAVLLNTTA